MNSRGYLGCPTARPCLVWHLILFISVLVDRSCASLLSYLHVQPSCGRCSACSARRRARAIMPIRFADVSLVCKRSRRLVGVRDSIQTSGVPTSLRMSPARTRICQRLRRALIRSQLPPVLNERFRALAVRTHSLSQVAMRPLAARRVIRAVRATGRRA